MGKLTALAGAVAVALLAAAGAAAMTPEQQDRLVALLEAAPDASSGIEVDGATVTAAGGYALTGEAACEFSKMLNGDEVCETSAIVFPPDGVGVDSIYYAPPENIGYVDMQEWTDDVSDEIDLIWESYIEGAKEQSKQLGEPVVPLRWVLYPTLNKELGVLTYGILISFDGDETINLTSIKFTRKGYQVMKVVTLEEILAEDQADFDSVTAYASETFIPATGLRYADFQAGDHVAEIGAVGVLASVMGVKYANKGTMAAIFAAVAIALKKFWFVLLAVPAALWAGFKKLFRRGG